MSCRFAIFNADDFGYSRGINRGIVRAHEAGIVSSTTFIVNGSAAAEAVRIARDLPELSVGLHVNFTNEADCFVDLENPGAIRSELRGQLDRFTDLMGGLPTHLDSHQHVHRDRRVRPHFEALADELRLPLRDRPPVVFKGGFYGQWEYGVSDRSKVSLEALERILRRELTVGIYEMSCHPGYVDPEFQCVYHQDREWELETLCDPRLPGILQDAGIALIAYRQLPLATAALDEEARRMATEGLTLPSAIGGSTASRAEGRAYFTPSPLALGFWLAVTLVLAKAVHWGVPGTWIALRDYLVDLPVSVHADLVFAAAFALLARFTLSAARARPSVHRTLGQTLLTLGAFSCLYAVASVQIFDFLRSPLTYPLLYLAGEMSNMRSSIGSFVTPGVGAALALAPLLYVAAVRTTTCAFAKLRLGVVPHAASWALLAALVFWARATLDGQWGGRADHLIAENPHWEFLSSLATDAFGTSGPRLGEEFPAAYLADFEPAPRAVPAFAPARRPRNVLLVVLESTGARYLSLYGSRYPTTPNLEREAAHARVFDRFYAHVGLTANSEAAMTLSVYPYMTWREYTVEYPQFPGEALGELLKPRGYRTAFLHSGHLEYVGQDRFLQNRGFDELLDWKDLGEGPGHFSWGGSDRVLIDRTLDWIDRDRERPFYAVMWTQQSHHPYEPVPGQEILGFFGKGPLPPDDWDLGRYLNTIHDADVQLGRLFAGLRERGLADDTLVVITGDHGETFGDPHPTWGHGFRVYDESVRVPLMVWNPQLFPQGGRSDTVGGHVDVNPTVAHLLGLPPSPTWQGRSLFEPNRPPRAYFYAANDDYLLGVREGDWKYVRNATRGRDELYYLPGDPDEQANVAALHPDRCLELRERVTAWRHFAAAHLAAARAKPATEGATSARVTESLGK